MKEFVSFLSDMDEKGIGVIAVKNGLDTSSSSGRMMMKLIGVLEEWNREMLIDRTNAGLARTVANGIKLGRTSVLTPSIKRKILDAKGEGASIRKIASEVGINRGAVQRFLQIAYVTQKRPCKFQNSPLKTNDDFPPHILTRSHSISCHPIIATP